MDNDSFLDFLDGGDEEEVYEDELEKAVRQYLEDEGISAMAAIDVIGNDIDSYVGLVRLFVEVTPERIGELKEYLANGDMLNYSILAHSTKSDSLLVGAEALSAVAKGHELEAKQDNEAYAKEHWDEFESLWMEYYKKYNRFLEEIDR